VQKSSLFSLHQSLIANSRVRGKFTHPAMLEVRGNKRA
jgi:hypothetical protein